MKSKEELGFEYYTSNENVTLKSTFCAGYDEGVKATKLEVAKYEIQLNDLSKGYAQAIKVACNREIAIKDRDVMIGKLIGALKNIENEQIIGGKPFNVGAEYENLLTSSMRNIAIEAIEIFEEWKKYENL